VSIFWRACAVLPTCLLTLSAAAASPTCLGGGGFDYMGDPITFAADRTAYFFATDTKLIDADGAPNAYHPADAPDACPDTGRGIDCLAAAGYPNGSWWQTVLAADPHDPDRPAIQADGRYKGYFVSMTSLRNTTAGGAASANSYVDAASIPYLVLPAPIYRTDGMGEMGDIGWATNLDTGLATPFVIADEGPIEPFGEASVAFWRALGASAVNPRNGAGLPDGRIAYVIFPGSGKDAALAWPIDPGALERAARQRLEEIGGQAMVRRCAVTSRHAAGLETAAR
jgi:hypothetical protein